MSQPFIGEIRMFGGNFAPAGWAFCDGQTLPISENDTLFVLLGTTYGGDGQETFNLPNLQSRVPVHTGGSLSYQLGETGGTESVTLTTSQIPTHTHTPLAVTGTPGNTSVPAAGAIMADSNTTTTNVYKTYDPLNAQVALNAATIGAIGGNQPHENIQPYLCVNYIISLFGVFPSQN